MDSVLFGRTVDAPLDAHGVRQARQLAARLRWLSPDSTLIEASPRLRTRQTAAAIAGQLARPVCIRQELDEIDFGRWAGQSFSELARDPDWQRWNEHRGVHGTPSGDSIAAVQSRVLRHLEDLCVSFTGGTIVLVTHAEIVRTLLLHFLGIPVGDFQRIRVEPASLSFLDYRDGCFLPEPGDVQVSA